MLYEAEESETKIRLQPETLQMFCNDLFVDTASDKVSHPIDDLQKFAKQFKKFSIGSKGIDVEANPPKAI